MELKILKGTRLLTARALLQDGEVYLPASILEQFTSRWEELVFFMSPLQGKKICLTVLGPKVRDALPPWIQHLAKLVKTAGATILWHDGGPLPQCDLILVLETGVSQIRVNHLGPAFRGAPLAKHVAGALKRGLKLAYLPDPLPFRKPEYNLKLSLSHWLFTPAVVIGCPEDQPDLSGWLFTALLGFWAQGKPPEENLFPLANLEAQRGQELPSSLELTSSLSAPPQEQPLSLEKHKISPKPKPHELQPFESSGPGKDEKPAPPQISVPSQAEEITPQKHRKPRLGKPVNPAMIPVIEARKNPSPPRPTESESSAGMSRAQYPEFFKQLEETKTKREIKKEPFS